MASVINTNSLSLLTQNNLNKSQASLNTAIQRLSSGLRINSAKDDAAGQAIANRFTANIKGLTQAQRNANDGISMAQTTEGALSEINTNLQRIRELTVQANNATNSDADKTSIQAEIEQRMAEIARTSEQTDFNGTKVLNSNQTLKIQVGANDGETIDIALKKMGLAELGLAGFNVDGGVGAANTAATAATAADLTGLGFSTTGVADANGFTTYTKSSAGATVSNAAATVSDVLGDVATNGTVDVGGLSYVKQAGGTYDYAGGAGGVNDAALTTALTPPASGTLTATVTIGGSAQNVVIDDAGNMTDAGGNQLYIDATGNLSLNNAGSDPTADIASVLTQMQATGAAGDSIQLTSGANSGMTYDWDSAGAWTASHSMSAAAMASAAASAGATVDVDGGGSTVYTVAAGGAVKSGVDNVFVDAVSSALTTNATSTQMTFENVYVDASGNVSNSNADADADGVADSGKQYFTAGALTSKAYVDGNGAATDDAFAEVPATARPLEVLDEALSRVDQLRSDLGAVQNRFDSVISNLGTTITNLTSSRSRIEDADYATEVSNMTRANILQQAGTSVLAQANQTTQGVLSLLR